ncbi:Glycine--tRNA ligase beta subunit [Nymphon striatum]|nr:Glycine--tRNA ligase beta subunit [Nymphon striatum]
MRWGSGSLRWVRPLHSILCILNDEAGSEVVPLDVDGIVSGNTTKGHRFLAPAAFSVTLQGLVEWPVVLMGAIDDAFLDLPAEVLQTSMKEHQKFFSVRNAKTGRIERFITVANMETADNGATILAGNQKVLFARLSDAKFFWQNDLRVAVDQKMQPWLDQLANVTFHRELGSQAARIDRIKTLGAGTVA